MIEMSRPNCVSKYIYVVLCVKTGLYKIGMSGCVERRLTEIDKALNIQEIKVEDLDFETATILECPHFLTRGLERALHRKYSHKHVRGEWYRLSFQDIQDIRQQSGSLNIFIGNLSVGTIKVSVGVSRTISSRVCERTRSGDEWVTFKLKTKKLRNLKEYSELSGVGMTTLIRKTVEFWQREELPTLMKPFEGK